MTDLDVYLGSELVGRLQGTDPRDVTFTYTEQWLTDGLAISRNLPLASEPAAPPATRVFFDGLLPEASLRTVLAGNWRLDPLDTFGLLEAIGRESAGAVTVLPSGEPMPAPGDVEWLTANDLEQKIKALPTAPFDSDPATGVRLSLGGAQDKLVLVRDGDRWGVPRAGTPSQYIAKPDPQSDRLQHLALNEFVCATWAASTGVEVAQTDLITVGGRRVLISTRFDRSGEGSNVTRLHQEDFAQLTGRSTLAKYEARGGPGVADCLAAINEVSADPVADRRGFIDRMWLNALMGNADAHSKNYSMLLHGRSWRLSPMYDINCTLVYRNIDHGLAMRLDGQSAGRVTPPDYLSGNALGHALSSWGYESRLGRRLAAERMVTLAERVVDLADPSALAGGDFSDLEWQHINLMSREVKRRSGNLRRTALNIPV